MQAKHVLESWSKILRGHTPMLSIEITRECPLRCPGCYAFGENHLGGGQTLRQLADYRGDSLVRGVLSLVDHHKPLHVTLVGGEPMIRHRELSRILPELATRVEPCVFGGDPDCSQCGCSASAAAHFITQRPLAGPLKIGHILQSSMTVGSAIARLQKLAVPPWRARPHLAPKQQSALVQISMD